MIHGCEGAYRAGCRCDECREYKRRANADYRARGYRAEQRRIQQARIDALMDAAQPELVKIHGIGYVKI
ncbi:hypothetical protein [Gordonibacter pamelaeae]|uniref:hypothetical protein n=1 Tax=Gordonibacter pamelaeae TaxID=471189 RepID=UPI003A8D8BC0